MRIAYFDCFAGLSSEMLLGALLGAGLSLDALRAILAHLPLGNYALDIQTVTRKELSGTYLTVAEERAVAADTKTTSQRNGRFVGVSSVHNHNGHHIGNARTHEPLTTARIVADSALPDLIRQTSLAIFQRLAQAEAKVSHERTRTNEATHCLEDIVTVVGVVAGLSLLGISRVECSPLQVGSGIAYRAGGVTPALSPTTAEMLRAASAPIYGSNITGELITPLGAAIITTIASTFGPIPAMKISAVGYGAGKDDLAEAPNLVRLFIGDTTGQLQTAPNLPGKVTKRTLPQPIEIESLPAQVAAGTCAKPYISNPEDWVSLKIKGHQQSGRQRIAS